MEIEEANTIIKVENKDGKGNEYRNSSDMTFASPKSGGKTTTREKIKELIDNEVPYKEWPGNALRTFKDDSISIPYFKDNFNNAGRDNALLNGCTDISINDDEELDSMGVDVILSFDNGTEKYADIKTATDSDFVNIKIFDMDFKNNKKHTSSLFDVENSFFTNIYAFQFLKTNHPEIKDLVEQVENLNDTKIISSKTMMFDKEDLFKDILYLYKDLETDAEDFLTDMRDFDYSYSKSFYRKKELLPVKDQDGRLINGFSLTIKRDAKSKVYYVNLKIPKSYLILLHNKLKNLSVKY